MSLRSRTTAELIAIVSSNGGLVIDAQLRPTSDLMEIAVAAKNKGARLTFTGMALRPTGELRRIALAGGGCVTFAD